MPAAHAPPADPQPPPLPGGRAQNTAGARGVSTQPVKCGAAEVRGGSSAVGRGPADARGGARPTGSGRCASGHRGGGRSGARAPQTWSCRRFHVWSAGIRCGCRKRSQVSPHAARPADAPRGLVGRPWRSCPSRSPGECTLRAPSPTTLVSHLDANGRPRRPGNGTMTRRIGTSRGGTRWHRTRPMA